MRIFCDSAVNKEVNRLHIGCIAYNNVGRVLEEIFKCRDADASLMPEVLAIEEALIWHHNADDGKLASLVI